MGISMHGPLAAPFWLLPRASLALELGSLEPQCRAGPGLPPLGSLPNNGQGSRSHTPIQWPRFSQDSLSDPSPWAHPEATGRRGHRTQWRMLPRTDMQDQREKAELSQRREAEAKPAGS